MPRSLRTFCAPFGVRFAYRQPSYRVRSRLVKVLPGSSSSTSAGGDLHDSPDAPEKRPEARERSMSDPTTPGTTAQLQDRPLRASSISKGKEKRDGRTGGGGKSSSAIVLNKEAKQALVRKHKKAVLLLEYDSYVPPPELVRCMKKVIAMMEKEGNKSVGRWYKKKRGTPKTPPLQCGMAPADVIRLNSQGASSRPAHGTATTPAVPSLNRVSVHPPLWLLLPASTIALTRASFVSLCVVCAHLCALDRLGYVGVEQLVGLVLHVSVG